MQHNLSKQTRLYSQYTVTESIFLCKKDASKLVNVDEYWKTFTFRLLVKQAMKHHDKLFLNVDFESPESAAPPQLNDHAFEHTKEAMKVAKNKRKLMKIYDSATKNFKGSEGADINLYSQTEALLRSKIRKLCNGTVGIISIYSGGQKRKTTLLVKSLKKSFYVFWPPL